MTLSGHERLMLNFPADLHMYVSSVIPFQPALPNLETIYYLRPHRLTYNQIWLSNSSREEAYFYTAR